MATVTDIGPRTNTQNTSGFRSDPGILVNCDLVTKVDVLYTDHTQRADKNSPRTERAERPRVQGLAQQVCHVPTHARHLGHNLRKV